LRKPQDLIAAQGKALTQASSYSCHTVASLAPVDSLREPFRAALVAVYLPVVGCLALRAAFRRLPRAAFRAGGRVVA